MRAIKFRKVVIAIEKPTELAVERTCLAKHSKKLNSLIHSNIWELSRPKVTHLQSLFPK